MLDVAKRALDEEQVEFPVTFTSPYPVGHYTIPFGKQTRERENVDGIKVFLYHGYAENVETETHSWVTSDHFRECKMATKSKSEKKIFGEILDCL